MQQTANTQVISHGCADLSKYFVRKVCLNAAFSLDAAHVVVCFRNNQGRLFGCNVKEYMISSTSVTVCPQGKEA